MPVKLFIPELGNLFIDDRDRCPGDSYTMGPIINPNDIQYFTFHHSVTAQTAKNDGDWKKEVDVIGNLHIPRFGGIGYRFIIASSGHVLYVGDLSRGGAAVADKNNIMFSACLVGDFTKELPTASQIHSAHLLAKYFLDNLSAYPQLDSWDDIKGHKNFNPTTCPSPNWEGVSDSLRNRIVGDIFQGYPSPSPVIAPPSPPPQPPVSDPLIVQVHDIIWGKGYTWAKLNKIKLLLPK